MNEFSGKSSSQIARELDSRRNHLRKEIDDLNEKFQPDQLWETAKSAIASPNSNEFVRNLGRSVRDNPLPVALVGAGIAWMIVDQGRKDRGADRFDRAGYDPDPVVSTHAPRQVIYDPAQTDVAKQGKDGSTVRDRVGEAGTRVRDMITSANEGARDRLTSARDGARDRLTSARDGARDRLTSTGDATRRRFSDAQARSQRTIRDASENVAQSYHANPLVFGLGAAAAAAILGSLLPSTRREEEVLGDYADQARDAAGTAVEKASEIAGKTAETIREESEKRGYSADTAEATASRAIDDVRDIAKKSVETIEKETRASVNSDNKISERGNSTGSNS